MAAISLMSISCAAATDLNAPLDERPTIRTEIYRGFRAAFNCVMEDSKYADGIERCALRHAGAEEQRMPNHLPFEVGLYYGACVFLRVQIEADTRISRSNSVAAAELPIVKHSYATLYRLFRQQQGILNISDKDLVDATGVINKAKAESLNELLLWARELPQGPLER
jgi:hypothetical protein